MTTSGDIQAQQKGTWNSAAPGWKKWDAFLLEGFDAVSEAMLDSAHLKEGDEILDLAGGTGEPGIPAARRIGRGQVTSTDLAEDMLAVAADKARTSGVTNFAVKVASALELPFPDARFDAVVCRWGIMFFPEPAACLKEALRVMKPGGHAAFATWNVMEKNPHLGLPLAAAVARLGMPPPSPDNPGPFRYTDPATLTAMMVAAGFGEIQIKEVQGATNFESTEHYWSYAMELVGPFRAAVQKVDPATLESVKAEVLRKAAAMERDGTIHMTYSSWVVSGRKA